ncbi:MAG: hypothetical protein LUE11_01365 [Clostridia bacterium]|nr:hypothetical protein [Clostridia bacterium]
MTGLTKRVSKKNVVKRQSRGYFWALTAIIAVMSVAANLHNMFGHIELFLILMAFVWLAVRIRNQKVLHNIRKQEKYLFTSMDEDMAGIRMQGFFSTGVEAVCYGDWYLLLSYYGAVAVNRRYITGVKKLERICRSGRYGGNATYTIRITFQTVVQETMTFTTGNASQAVEDLCSWLGMEPEERKE